MKKRPSVWPARFALGILLGVLTASQLSVPAPWWLQSVINFSLLGATVALWAYARELHSRVDAFDALLSLVPHMLKIAAKTGSATAAVDEVERELDAAIRK